MKQCIRCHETLPLSEFYRHTRMADGHMGKCKPCTRQAVQGNYAKQRERYREYDRQRYANDPARKKFCLGASGRRDPIKRRAQWAVQNAVRSGRLVRQPCDTCGATRAEAHHPDYTRPLDVQWLCRVHHMVLHRMEKSLAFADGPVGA